MQNKSLISLLTTSICFSFTKLITSKVHLLIKVLSSDLITIDTPNLPLEKMGNFQFQHFGICFVL